MKRVLVLSFVGAFLLALPGSHLVWGKAHVPIDRVQVCDDEGDVKNIKPKNLKKKLDEGGCRLPACDFNNIFMAGEICFPTDADMLGAGGGPDGFCDLPNERDSATGRTALCTENVNF